jgi:hypothetical protein
VSEAVKLKFDKAFEGMLADSRGEELVESNCDGQTVFIDGVKYEV